MAHYPKVAELVQFEWDRLQAREKKRISIREMAERLDASPASVIAWRAGSRAVAEASATRLAEVFFSSARDRQKFVAQILAATAEGLPDAVTDPLEPLIAGAKERVEIRIVPSGALADVSDGDGATRGFFAEVFINGFLRTCFKPAPVKQTTLKSSVFALSSGEADVVLPMLASADRAPALNIYPTSIRIGLNFIVPTAFRRGAARDELMDALSVEPRADNRLRDRLCLLVEDDELSGHFVRVRGFPERRIIPVERLDAEGTAEEFLKLVDGLAVRKPGSASALNEDEVDIPVIVFDELSCARVLATKRLSRRKKICGLLYDPWLPAPTPSWHLGYAVSRKSSAWAQFLRSSFDRYVESFAHDVAHWYVRLAEELHADLLPVVVGLDDSGTGDSPVAKTWRWVERTLSLDEEGAASLRRGAYPSAWGRILELTRQAMSKSARDTPLPQFLTT